MVAEPELSPLARQRMAAQLPALLVVVRARRRRRLVRRAALALVALALPGLGWLLASAPTTPPPAPGVAAAPAWVVVHDDPTILARCEVQPAVRPDWLLTDDGLQAELRAADRPDGLVRTGGVVLVSAAAVDPWPERSL